MPKNIEEAMETLTTCDERTFLEATLACVRKRKRHDDTRENYTRVLRALKKVRRELPANVCTRIRRQIASLSARRKTARQELRDIPVDELYGDQREERRAEVKELQLEIADIDRKLREVRRWLRDAEKYERFPENAEVMTTEGPAIIMINYLDGDLGVRWPGHEKPSEVHTVSIDDVWFSADFPDDDVDVPAFLRPSQPAEVCVPRVMCCRSLCFLQDSSDSDLSDTPIIGSPEPNSPGPSLQA
jgi:hypothetical protein